MEAAPPTPPHPVNAAKHVHGAIKGKFTGHPKWVYIAGATVLIGVAFLVWRRSKSGAAQANANTTQQYPDPTQAYYPDATQGAYGGYNDPSGGAGASLPAPAGAAATDPAYGPLPYYSTDPGLVPPDTSVAPDAPRGAAMPTGGGTVPARSVAHHWTPPPAGTYAGIAYNATGAPLSPPTWQSVMATGSLKGTNLDLKTETAPQGFPHKGPHGWYRTEAGGGRHSGHQVHVYQSGVKVYV